MLLVEMPTEAACCAPAGNARAAAWVVKAEVTTRTKSMAAITFLIVDVEEVADGIINS
jgi:hypothetical protein